MSSIIATNRRKLAYELGSQADTRQFIPFSKNTNTNRGRKVFIDAALAPLFAHFFQADDASTIRIVSKIEQLSAVAGGIAANTNVTTPFEYMENIGELAIYYQLHNSPQGHRSESGVYITGIQKSSRASNQKPGLWEVTPDYTREIESGVAEHSIAFVSTEEDTGSAAVKNAEKAGKNGWGGINSFNFFFVPKPIENEMGLWITPDSRSLRPATTAKILADVLTKTQNFKGHKEPIKWTIERDTVKLLQLSLDHLPNLLDRLEFTLVDPVADTISIIQSLEYRGAKVTANISQDQRAKAAASLSAARSNKPDSPTTRAIAEKGADANKALAEYSNLQRVKTNFVDYVRNLTGTMAW